jgi:hypothetical protein
MLPGRAAGKGMLFSPLGPGGPAELFVFVLAHLLFAPFNNATHDLTSLWLRLMQDIHVSRLALFYQGDGGISRQQSTRANIVTPE